MDEIISTGSCLQEPALIKRTLDPHFKTKDFGVLRYFLGLKVADSQIRISLCQKEYCLNLLMDSGMIGSKPAKTTSDLAVCLSQDDGEPYSDGAAYHRLVRWLLYLMTMRPGNIFST